LDQGTVIIVDDDAAIRTALGDLLESADYAVTTFDSARAFLDGPVTPGAACLLLDVRLPELSGLDLQGLLRAEGRELPIIFMTGHATVPMTVQAMKAGAQEFLTKPVEETALLAAVADAIEQHRRRLASEEGLADLRARREQLTPREAEVMDFVIGGLMNKQLAGAIGTTEITAKVHKRRVMEKMGARSLLDLVRMAERLGLSATPLRPGRPPGS